MNLNDELEIVRYIIDEKKIIYYSKGGEKEIEISAEKEEIEE